MRFIIKCTMLMLWLALATNLSSAQTNNLLQNPNADEGATHWRAFRAATVEQTSEGNPQFVVRNGGYFIQDVKLPEGAVGKFALLIGRVSSERINADGAITGLPSLHGEMMEYVSPRGGRILAYLGDQQMLCAARKENEWVAAWGIFQVPAGTVAITFSLNQAERKDVPQNGSAARFDDLGLYLFDSELEAHAFVKAYKENRQ